MTDPPPADFAPHKNTLIRYLRWMAVHGTPDQCAYFMGQAADEIERLREQLRAVLKHVEELRQQ